MMCLDVSLELEGGSCECFGFVVDIQPDGCQEFRETLSARNITEARDEIRERYSRVIGTVTLLQMVSVGGILTAVPIRFFHPDRGEYDGDAA